MKFRHLVPFAILLAWQQMPDTPPPRFDGRFRLSYGYGVAFYLRDWFGSDTYCGGGCDGSCATSRPYLHPDGKKESYEVQTVQLEAWPSSTFRIAGSAGSAQGAFDGGLLAAWEGRAFGVGAGYAGTSDPVGRSGLAGYLRAGKLDGVHLRAELLAPNPVPGAGETGRVGLGYNLGRVHGWGWYFGYAGEPGHAGLTGAPTSGGAMFGEVNVPIARTTSLLLRGHTGEAGSGLGIAFRLGFGH